MGEMIEIPTLDGEARFAAYLAEPGGAPRAAIIVIQEIFGVNANIRRKVDEWAAKGYLALAPDMFWRFAPGYDVDPDIPEQLAQAMAQRSQFDTDKAVADVEAALRHARAIGVGKVGVVGFCWGGAIAYLAATRTDADASVGYYGRLIAEHLNEAHAIARPLMLHFGEEDPSIPTDVRAKISEALASNPRVTIHEHAGAGHGFAAAFGKRRNENAAQHADALTDEFFEHQIRHNFLRSS
ncbi:dienelactone hydrolase family protein [Sphingomonas crusticola]|uniref:dienelactone hydrolase family protein n=1 Tax=Sphingomonas crusticola TaxID=1697973 RepID=UPI000E2370A1|nr:dienelactone hydrolase family protein [Sphingomonas crusticola]